MTVEELNSIIGLYSNDSKISQLLKLTGDSMPTSVHLKGLKASSNAFVIAGAWQNSGRQMLIVAHDQEEAAYLHNTLDNILPDAKVYFLCDSFKRPGFFEQVSSHQVLQRTEIINQMTDGNPKGELIISYPEALFELVVSPQVMEAHQIKIVKDEVCDMDSIIEILVDFGFERTDFVYEPGHFSVRGGIIDIFSHGNEWPYRIELFGDKVESIRLFDPMTQLSQKNVSRIVIIPHVNRSYKIDQKVKFIDVLDPQAMIWIADQDLLLDRLQSCFEQVEKLGERLFQEAEDDLQRFIADRAFCRPGDFMSKLNDFNRIYYVKNMDAGHSISFNIAAQPSFNKNFKLLIENLQNNTKGKITNYIFTDNNRQIERFHAIFTDLGAKVDYLSVFKGIDQGFIDLDLKIACYTDHQIFDRFHAYHMRKGFTRDMAMNLRMLREMQPGDFVTHIDHGVGRYSGLEKITLGGHVQESVRLVYKNNDLLYVGINSLHKISKYTGKDGTEPVLSKLGSDTWKNLKAKAKKKVKDIAAELIKLYAKRKVTPGYEFPPDGYLQNELEASFLYEDTPDQYKATVDVKTDMEKPHPMDRLVCGDVGFGKTEIALRAAFKAVTDGKQVAVLVPTTILALQHFKTFSERLIPFGVEVDYMNRFRSTAEKKEVIAKLGTGKLDIVIGTHALINKDVKFKDLGLLVIDEEQKFGVAAKEKLRSIKINVDTLTLTATPIPRTLQFSLLGARDFSVIRTAPPNRQPIHTESRVWNEDVIKDAIFYETQRGGQVFFVHNRVKSLEEVAAVIKRLCPGVSVGVAHGQMDANNLEKILVAFIDKKYDVLACTNIIETGLDIPNANTILINNAHQFGLSDLHQLRGRVGRSNKKAYCYLLCPPKSTMTSDARKRIQTLEDFSDLGSGFTIAMKDLDIRGAGNLLGGEQSGFIADIGYEVFQKILDETILELKTGEMRDSFLENAEMLEESSFIKDIQIDTDVEMLIPDEYVSNIPERLSLYTELDRIEDETGLQEWHEKMVDRFGKLPIQVEELCEGLRLRWTARKLGFERIILKNNQLRCYFPANPQSLYYESKQFQALFSQLQTLALKLNFQVKQSNNSLFIFKEQVKSLSQAKSILSIIQELALK